MTKLQNVDAINMAFMLAVGEANVFQGKEVYIQQCFALASVLLHLLQLFILRLNVCDGSFDCLDGTDEFICPTNSKYMIELWKNQTAEAEEAAESETETTTVLSSLKVNSKFPFLNSRELANSWEYKDFLDIPGIGKIVKKVRKSQKTISGVLISPKKQCIFFPDFCPMVLVKK